MNFRSEREPEPDVERLGSLERAGAAMAGLGAVSLFGFTFVARSFAQMFKDLGGELPFITELATSTWFPILLGLLAAVGVGLGIRPGPIGLRRAAILAAFVIATGGAIVCIIGLYLPIFSLAGNIKAN